MKKQASLSSFLKPSVLIVEETELLRQQLRELLLKLGMEICESSDRASALRELQSRPFKLVIAGSLAGSIWQGLELAAQIRERDRGIPVMLLTNRGSEELATAVLRAGLVDYCKYPISFQEMKAAIERCFNGFDLRQPVAETREANSPLIEEPAMVGTSPSVLQVRSQIARVALTDSNVLVTGETGTGKELVAELIHKSSARKDKPFVCLNCAAIPESLLESELFGHERGAFTGADSMKEGKLKLADHGTFLFDEIGDMSPMGQAKILRAIESKEVRRLGGNGTIAFDVRIVAATNQDLERLVSEGRFRKDLYFRLNVVRIHLPPLRERKEDLPRLASYYIHQMNRRFRRQVEGFTEDALRQLLHFDWPGNVRELKNLLEATFVNLSSSRITVADLPEHLQRHAISRRAERRGEQERLLSALLSTSWNKSRAAERLHWSRVTLYRKMAKYRLSCPNLDKPESTETERDNLVGN